MTPALSSQAPVADDRARRRSKMARRVAAVAGAAGAAAAGDANAITYVPTAGVLAAQGIPGFSFTPPTSVTTGTLTPPSFGTTPWDIDGSGEVDFILFNGTNFFPNGLRYAKFVLSNSFLSNPNGVVATSPTGAIRNLADGSAVGPSAVWNNNIQIITSSYVNVLAAAFPTNQPGAIGFRFAFGDSPNQYYYGWASLTINAASPPGQSYRITEAFYQSTPNTAINVGAVPVPEPSSMALLAIGAAGVVAWRARRQQSSSGG